MKHSDKNKKGHEEIGMEFGDVNGIELYQLLVPNDEKDNHRQKKDNPKQK
ncbi:hypothetical protein [Bacillus sp. B-jedd]|nr:hypothetical protein [Bacillus sp. B-jedd]CEG26597.1 hypothetical protein BN1002_01446 [Bacillus sp. B-jedd]